MSATATGPAAAVRLRAAALGPTPMPLARVEPSPCTTACPAGVNVKAYVSLIAEGRFAEAHAVVRERCPLPGICGRICHHPCEAACRRDQPLAIRALKRFAADVADETPPPPVPLSHPDTPIAVIGSGPAGLTAAWDLRREGYPVTVFEAEPEPGGMLRYGIAPYRLPRPVLDAEIGYLLAAGIEIRTGCRIGREIELTALLDDDWAAVLFAVGAQRGRSLGIPGADEAAEVEDALGFLRRVNAGDRTPIAGRVLVIGGGSTAVEAARTARRLGASEVTILYRRSRSELLAGPEEIEACAAEGIGLRFLVAPQAVVRDAERFLGLECLRVELGEPDASGRRRPLPIAGSEFLVEAERVLAAVGQQADLDFLPERYRPRICERGRLRANDDSAMTALQGVFAAGDVVTGPATVIEAVAAGHRAAATIRSYLATGRPAVDPSPAAAPEYELPEPPPEPSTRRHPPTAPLSAGQEFAETERAFGPAEAMAEAQRCLRCGPCSECLLCAPSCRRRHLVMRTGGDGPTVLLRASAALAAGLPADPELDEARLTTNGTSSLGVSLWPTRMRVRSERCRACGSCREVCPFDALTLEPDDRAVAVEASRCRGCQLCAAVCPTDALVSDVWSAAWWLARFAALDSGNGKAAPWCVVGCAARGQRLSRQLRQGGLPVELVEVRCVGAVDAGRLLELLWRGAERVFVAGCPSGRCRYDGGEQQAGVQTARAREMLRLIGEDPDRVVYDRSAAVDAGLADGSLTALLQTATTAAAGAAVES